MQPQKEVSSIPAHTAVPFTLTVAAGSCPMPLEVAFSFLYTWTLEKIDPQKPHRLSNPKNTTPDSLQIRTSPPTGSNPAEHNFAIQIPPRPHYSRAVPGLPDRHYTGSITTEPILVTSAWAAFVQRLLALASSLASKFTWPILIAFLTIVGQNALARRGERQQIRNNRLDALTSLMQQHYLPITRRMETVTIESQKLPPLRRNLQEALNAPTPDPALTHAAAEAFTFQSRRIFAAILLMRKRILCLIESKGGVFFPSPLAEEIFTGGYSYFYGQFKTSIKDSDHCETLAASLGINTPLHQAHARLFPSRRPINLKTQHALNNFLLWIQDTGTDDDFDRYVVFLDLCEAVMLFEFDRVQYETHAPVFQHNFLDPPPFKFTGTLDKLPPLDGLPDSDPEAERPRFLAKCARYFEGIPEECRPNLLYPGRSS
jgi:hypothetical protein